MTRFARVGQGNKKLPHAATSWQEMKKTGDSKNRQDTGQKSSETSHNKRKAWLNEGSNQSNELHSKSKKHRKKKQTPTTELATELTELKASVAGDLSKEDREEIDQVIKKDERREKRRIKRIDKKQLSKTCYNCREKGHDMFICPKLRNPEQGGGICFKCGSMEHSMKQCRVKLPPGELPYAKCFICDETGHLSKQCPDNPRGLYPNGGCCRVCGSVEHYKNDCPDFQQKQGIGSLRLERLDASKAISIDDEPSLHEDFKPPPKKKPKVVKF